MARIVYGIAAEGMGHATRSRPIIEELRKSHQVKVVTGDRAYDYLRKDFDCEKIQSFHIRYRNNAVSDLGTFFMNLKNSRRLLNSFRKVRSMINEFRPDMIITDFEPFTNYIGNMRAIPVISIDNMNILLQCRLDIPAKYWVHSLKSRIITKLLCPSADRYIITTFFYPEVKNDKATLVAPILRKEIVRLKPRKEDFVLVYQTSRSNKKLFELLKRVDEKFVIYGFNKERTDKNLHYKKSSNEEYYDNLRKCKAVITNGGFSLISEALYMKKPVLSIPVRKQFEQTNNALWLEREGYGKFSEKPCREDIESFLRSRYKTCEMSGNKEVIRLINSYLKANNL